MIDAESMIYSEIYNKVVEKFPDVYMTGEEVKVPSEFPCVSLVEADNATYSKSSTTEENENHAAVMYELNVYSNKVTGKKAECREIASFVDKHLMNLNFTRTMLRSIPNRYDTTVFRMTGRYKAVISKGYQIYRR